MDIHEYQAKELLSEFGVPIPRGGLAYSPEQAAYRAREIGGERWAVKAQVKCGRPRQGWRDQTLRGADEKVEILQQAGVAIAPNPAELGATMARILSQAKAA